MKAGRIVIGLLSILALGAAGFFMFAWRAAIDPVEPPAPAQFQASTIRKGAQLAALGDCVTCHTAPGGKAFAGGRALATPFGTIYATNITPDAKTGIGGWSEPAFRRAMHEGVDRDGRHLYPAFPYDHFSLVKDEDVSAIYAFMMTRQPVAATAPENELRFPFNIRMLIAGWKLLYLKPARYLPESGRDEVFNRGAYLAEGLSHCSACHSPRNLLGAETSGARFAGGRAEDWYAYALDTAALSLVRWDEAALYSYLRLGWHGLHGVARGPMAPVIDNLGIVPDDDIHALARYVASVMGAPRVPQPPFQPGKSMSKGTGSKPQSGGIQSVPAGLADAVAGRAQNEGKAIYASTCAGCHESGRPVPFGGIDLRLSTSLSGASSANLINIILLGLPAEAGAHRPIMPNFATVLSDGQVAALTRYLRSEIAEKPAWSDMDDNLRAARARAKGPAALAKTSPKDTASSK